MNMDRVFCNKYARACACACAACECACAWCGVAWRVNGVRVCGVQCGASCVAQTVRQRGMYTGHGRITSFARLVDGNQSRHPTSHPHLTAESLSLCTWLVDEAVTELQRAWPLSPGDCSPCALTWPHVDYTGPICKCCPRISQSCQLECLCRGWTQGVDAVGGRRGWTQ